MANKTGKVFRCFCIFISVWRIAGAALPDSIKSTLQIITETKPDSCVGFAEYGDTVEVHYLGMLGDGAVFDSTADRSAPPMKFVLGANHVIQGFSKGIQGMCVGEARKVVIPPSLAYGSGGLKGIIPGSSKLIFQIQLMDLQKYSWVPNTEKVVFYCFVIAAFLTTFAYMWGAAKQSTSADRKTEKRHGKKKR